MGGSEYLVKVRRKARLRHSLRVARAADTDASLRDHRAGYSIHFAGSGVLRSKAHWSKSSHVYHPEISHDGTSRERRRQQHYDHGKSTLHATRPFFAQMET